MQTRDPVAVFSERLAQSGHALLVVDEDLLRETSDVRDVLLRSAGASGLVFAQTEPPLGSEAVGREMEVVVLPLPEEESSARPLGFRAQLREAGGDALVFPFPDTAREVGLRSVHRLTVRPEWKLWLRLEGLGEAELLDVSARGALAVVRGEVPGPGGKVRFVLGMADDWEVEGVASVRRVMDCAEEGCSRLALYFEPDVPAQGAQLQRRLSALG